MALIDALLEKVSNDSLRAALREQVDHLLGKQSFGLVYQQHKPETVELHNYRVARNCKVKIKSEGDDLYAVDQVKRGVATIRSLVDEPEFWEINVEELVVVREFGDAIYPGLDSLGAVDRGGDKPPHLVINAENFHALELLLYTHEGLVDAIYIDPPYNTRDKDWKYNNDYVDTDDIYRHSKWLAMMQRRLAIAGRLLKPDSSVLIVTIDENEVHRLGLLLEQTFPDANLQMVTIVNNAPGQARKQELSRVEEYAFFLFFGEAAPFAGRDDMLNERPSGNPDVIRWESLLRSGTNSRRQDRPQLFYPIFVNVESREIVEVGDPKSVTTARSDWDVPKGTVAIWPLKANGDEGRWKLKPATLRKEIADGYAKLGEYRQDAGRGTFWYLGRGAKKAITAGEIVIKGRDDDGAVVVEPAQLGAAGRRSVVPMTVWNRASHHAGWHGSAMVNAMLVGKSFPFPKSVYAVRDALRTAVGGKPEAVVVDFFAGSGTTAHALAMLNAEDGGRRQSILITNNEVSAVEATELSEAGHKPGDAMWEATGIFHAITRPRVEAAFTGVRADGTELKGEYLDGGSFADGYAENAEFFNLTYEDPDLVSLGRRFEELAPLLWLKAGGVGARIEKENDSWVLPDDAVYGVLFDANRWRDFVSAVIKRAGTVRHFYVATESEAVFQQILSEMPAGVSGSRLYDHYLTMFERITKGRS